MRLTLILLFAALANAQNPFDAVRANDLKSVEAWLSGGGDVNARDSHSTPLLMQAAAYGSPEAVALLLSHGAEVNATNDFGATALLWAANQPAKARMLVEKGADVKLASKQGRTPLMIAATCNGCGVTVRMLIAKGSDVNAHDVRGGSALNEAATIGDTETIRFLIEHGADAVSPDKGGYTPLMLMAANCDLPSIRLTIARGANVNATNSFSGTVRFGPIDIVHMTPLMFAAPHCSPEIVRTLLDAGARINETDSRGMTPLMFAVTSESSSPAVVHLLLASGADVKIKSLRGETALDWAAKFGNREILTVLSAARAPAGEPFTAPIVKPVGDRDPSQAVESGVAILQKSTAEFFKQSGCNGCHHQPISIMADAAASAAHLKTDKAIHQQAIATVRSLTFGNKETQLERFGGGGLTDPPAYALLALNFDGAPATAESDSAALYIAGAQHQDGAWYVPGSPRAPIQEGAIGRSVIAGRAIQIYGPPARRPEMDERLARLRNWLLTTKASTNDDFAMQTLGLKWLGATAAQVSTAGTGADCKAASGWRLGTER